MLPRLHLPPIKVVFSDRTKSPNLGMGFSLRCFQRLSLPDIATQQCSWRNSWHTRGRFILVLSY